MLSWLHSLDEIVKKPAIFVVQRLLFIIHNASLEIMHECNF